MHHHAHMHLDLDSFFVSVECLNNPALKGKPVIVGGTSMRGVVAACSYEARKYGLHSAMPIATARKLCPNGIYLSGDMEAYSKKSKEVTDIVMAEAPVVEKASIDEFYLDLTGMDRFFGIQKFAWELREKITKETGLPLSAGLSINKTVCKIATNEAKPNGKKYVPFEEVKPFLAPLDIQKMPMVGDVTARFMRDMGIYTIGQLMNFPVDVLTKVLGKNGYSLWERANGIDHSPVVPYSEAKSLSTEQTFHTDTTDMRFLHTTLTAMVEELSYKLRAENYMTSCVSVKIRYSDFDTKTQQITIPYTSREDVLLKAIYALFEKCFDRRLLIRLIGIRFSKLVNANYQLTLFDQAEKKVNLMFAMDKIRNRYGVDKISRVDGLFSLGGKRKKQDNFFNPKNEK
ncbi:MAG: DNA polymerase IV [Sphingobacteriales bacterium]|nr:MAG: DNA polymerase IV [Sphingobacteriales bacterium]